MRNVLFVSAGALVMFYAYTAQASCGAAFCSVNTQWNTQGVWTESGRRADLRYEYVPQAQPRAGAKEIGVGQIPHHHDEVETFNRNLLATLDYGAADGWGVSASLPLVGRYHRHIHNHMGSPIREQWDFTEIGDAQLLGRYQFQNWNHPYVFGIYLGAKLPTGRLDVSNSDGDLAERSLQPGTGTTDALLGFYTRRNLSASHSSVFAQVLTQLPLYEHDGYKPGEKLSADLGYRYDATERLSLLLQMNGQYKWRDSGLEAEAEDSGGYSISISPGISYGLSETVQLYGLLEKPIHQYVNGVQLTADWSAVSGISVRF